MAHKRTEFTETQKAKIFVRDKATCAFSCVSLWLLDYGIRPNRQIDWVDHLKPSASGGQASLDNGVCVSHTFNAKKKGNASDNICFVRHGKITKEYIWMFGQPTNILLERLRRLSNLEECDWYFNKCIDNVLEGLTWRCEVEFKQVRYKRDDNYWFNSGWKRLVKFQKKKPMETMLERGLLLKAVPFGSEMLIELERIKEEGCFYKLIEDFYPIFRENYKLLHSFYESSLEDSERLVAGAINNKMVHPEVVGALNTLLKGKHV